MALPSNMGPFNAVEVRFKNGRKEFFQNPDKLTLSVGDGIATEASPGHDIGLVTLTGELVRIQMRKKRVPLNLEALQKVYRKATQKDIDLWQELRAKENDVQKRSREIAIQHGLKMKISDVEYQGDGSKVIFYYTADDRVDFRQLIRDYARTFNTRIEMKQIGFRQEAARLGGIGSCGRELCCSTWLTDFRSVSTKAARYQQLSLNPQKLAGQCGKLKCCLNYELDMYVEALKEFPSPEIRLKTKNGTGIHIKTDVFKRLMWYLHQTDKGIAPAIIGISPVRVKEIIEMNEDKKYPEDLADFSEATTELELETPEYSNAVDQDDLHRFDDTFAKKKKKKKKNSANRAQGARRAQGDNKPQAASDKPKSDRGPRKPSENKPKKQQPKAKTEAKPKAEGEVKKDAPKANKRRPQRKPNDKNNPRNKNNESDKA